MAALMASLTGSKQSACGITDEMALQLGELAERHTKEEREKFEAEVITIRGRGGDAQAQRTGATFACDCQYRIDTAFACGLLTQLLT